MANYNYKHINANASQQLLATGAGSILGAVNVNTLGATANVLTLYDAAVAADCVAGNVVAVIDTTKTGVAGYDYNLVLNRGLFYTLATGTAADVTITFR